MSGCGPHPTSNHRSVRVPLSAAPRLRVRSSVSSVFAWKALTAKVAPERIRSVIERGRCVEPVDTAITRQHVHSLTLDAIIAGGYQVNSYPATQFRIWATRVLREYLIKGFALDDERLKQGGKISGQRIVAGPVGSQSPRAFPHCAVDPITYHSDSRPLRGISPSY